MEILNLQLSIIFWKTVYREPLTASESETWLQWRAAHPDIDDADLLESELQEHHAFIQDQQAALTALQEKLNKSASTIVLHELPVEAVPALPAELVGSDPVIPWYRRGSFLAAASLIAVVLVLTALWYNRSTTVSPAPAPVAATIPPIAPADTAVMIELANGQLKAIGVKDTGLILTAGAMQLIRQASGNLVYRMANTNNLPASNKIRSLHRKPVTVQLADGSQVRLDPGAELEIPVHYNAIRSVGLQGLAYFMISHDANKPFSVKAGPVEVKVLGTQFMVRARDEQHALIGLTQGKVALLYAGKETTMQPGQVASIDHHGLRWLDHNLTSLTAFTRNEFYYAGSPLRTIQQDLEDWYQVKLKDNKPIDDSGVYHFGPVSRDLPLQEVLNKVEKMTGHRLQRKRP